MGAIWLNIFEFFFIEARENVKFVNYERLLRWKHLCQLYEQQKISSRLFRRQHKNKINKIFTSSKQSTQLSDKIKGRQVLLKASEKGKPSITRFLNLHEVELIVVGDLTLLTNFSPIVRKLLHQKTNESKQFCQLCVWRFLLCFDDVKIR